MVDEKLVLFNKPIIVVTRNPKEDAVNAAFATVYAVPGKYVRVKGAGFYPGKRVNFTICEEDKKIRETAVANKCGAFEVIIKLPASISAYNVVSLKAWIDEKPQAAWPLDLVKA